MLSEKIVTQIERVMANPLEDDSAKTLIVELYALISAGNGGIDAFAPSATVVDVFNDIGSDEREDTGDTTNVFGSHNKKSAFSKFYSKSDALTSLPKLEYKASMVSYLNLFMQMHNFVKIHQKYTEAKQVFAKIMASIENHSQKAKETDNTNTLSFIAEKASKLLSEYQGDEFLSKELKPLLSLSDNETTGNHVKAALHDSISISFIFLKDIYENKILSADLEFVEFRAFIKSFITNTCEALDLDAILGQFEAFKHALEKYCAKIPDYTLTYLKSYQQYLHFLHLNIVAKIELNNILDACTKTRSSSAGSGNDVIGNVQSYLSCIFKMLVIYSDLDDAFVNEDSNISDIIHKKLVKDIPYFEKLLGVILEEFSFTKDKENLVKMLKQFIDVTIEMRSNLKDENKISKYQKIITKAVHHLMNTISIPSDTMVRFKLGDIEHEKKQLRKKRLELLDELMYIFELKNVLSAHKIVKALDEINQVIERFAMRNYDHMREIFCDFIGKSSELAENKSTLRDVLNDLMRVLARLQLCLLHIKTLKKYHCLQMEVMRNILSLLNPKEIQEYYTELVDAYVGEEITSHGCPPEVRIAQAIRQGFKFQAIDIVAREIQAFTGSRPIETVEDFGKYDSDGYRICNDNVYVRPVL